MVNLKTILKQHTTVKTHPVLIHINPTNILRGKTSDSPAFQGSPVRPQLLHTKRICRSPASSTSPSTVLVTPPPPTTLCSFGLGILVVTLKATSSKPLRILCIVLATTFSVFIDPSGPPYLAICSTPHTDRCLRTFLTPPLQSISNRRPIKVTQGLHCLTPRALPQYHHGHTPRIPLS